MLPWDWPGTLSLDTFSLVQTASGEENLLISRPGRLGAHSTPVPSGTQVHILLQREESLFYSMLSEAATEKEQLLHKLTLIWERRKWGPLRILKRWGRKSRRKEQTISCKPIIFSHLLSSLLFRFIPWLDCEFGQRWRLWTWEAITPLQRDGNSISSTLSESLIHEFHGNKITWIKKTTVKTKLASQYGSTAKKCARTRVAIMEPKQRQTCTVCVHFFTGCMCKIYQFHLGSSRRGSTVGSARLLSCHRASLHSLR